MRNKIKTILAGIEGLEERTKNSDCSTEFRHGQNRAYTLVKELIYQQFPELNESEDERIRNEIIAFIEQAIHRGGGTPIPKEKEDKWIAYLEKQKEQDTYKSSKSEIDFADRYSNNSSFVL